MCIMATPVESVTDTKIFVGYDPASKRQAIVYEMVVALQDRVGKGTAMVLPVPVGEAGPESIQLVDLSKFPEFFAAFEDMFKVTLRSLSFSKGLGALEVVRVGNYDVSIVPTVEDVGRLNPDVFELSEEARATLVTNYPFGFAFVVAQLRESGKFHPLAYTHPKVLDNLFVPTRHEHGTGDDALPEWDHAIFYQEGHILLNSLGASSRGGMHVREAEDVSMLRYLQQDLGRRAPALASYLPGKLIYQLRAKGRLPNCDLFLAPRTS